MRVPLFGDMRFEASVMPFDGVLFSFPTFSVFFSIAHRALSSMQYRSRFSALSSCRSLAVALLAVTVLSGCLEQVPGLGPDPRLVMREKEGRAIGGACRHAMRGLEDCYTINPKVSKSYIFEGWKEMDEYMREHKLEGEPAVFTQKPAAPKKPAVDEPDPVPTTARSTSSRG